MEDTSTDAPTGITLLGSEMLTWSDQRSDVGPVRGRVATALLHGFGGSRTRALVAGPHSAPVVTEVAGQFDAVDVLVRSLEDARTLREQVPGTVHVFCGPLDRLAAAQRYDAVIALDGLDRLHSAEEAQPAWAVTLGQLVALVAEGGELYLGIGNDAGVDRLLSLGPHQRHDDAHWPNARFTTGDLPLGLDELTSHLAAEHQLNRIEAWACYGPRSEPLLAAPAAVYETFRRDARLAALVSRAARGGVEGAVPVRDVGDTARTLVRHGLGAELAPLWVLHFRAGAPAGEVGEAVVLFAEPEPDDGAPDDGSTALLVRITPAEGEWRRELLSDPAPPPREALVQRDPALLASPVPQGRLLDAQLTDLCADMDLTAVGVLVRRYRDWLASDAKSDQVAAPKVPVTFDNLVDTGTDLQPFDPSRHASAAASVQDVLARTLLVASRALLSSGHRHPWPVSHSPEQVARALVATTGTQLDDAGLARAVELDRALTAGGEVPDPVAGASPQSYAEAIELLEGYRRRTGEMEAQLEWLVVNIHQRQRILRSLRARVEALEGSRLYWLHRQVRKLVERIRKPRPMGEWTGPAREREPWEVEPELLPPGYETKGPTI